ncbi:unnamed protein product, partial [Vitis vinifera]|uniref:protein disulfide-isomerase n=3 Tax=Vitis vinifera TaxID=29760 RepID=D7SWG9_VITVI|eukprot:XP_010652943.2 PREDICTED: protein disulfide-isomerase [Vitis vinifera]
MRMVFPMECKCLFSVLVLFSSLLALCTVPISAVEGEFVVTLDYSNFTETVAKQDFIVVEFYAPWCGHCQQLAPEYEKAASVLSSHDPPIILAKVNGDDAANRQLGQKFDIKGFPTLFIVKDGGKKVQEYNGPPDADGIVNYLKRQLGPASTEIKSSEDAATFIDEKGVAIVGVFPDFSGEEFDNFISIAENLRSDYVFGHTLDAKLLPRGESSVKGPIVRLFKPFDELYVDFQDFEVDALEKFVKEASMPLVTIFDSDPSGHGYVAKFFDLPNDKVMLVVEFNSEEFDAFNSKYRDAAELYKGKNLGFLLGDVNVSEGAVEYYGLKADQTPLIIIDNNDLDTRYFEAKIKPDQIAPWLEEYLDGRLKPFIKSQPIPETNDGPVKVAVFETLEEIVFNSGKNVLIEFYAPWCGHCQRLAPILEEAAVSFQNDPDIIIAKLDATVNDIPKKFKVEGFPTMYFKPANGELVEYGGDATKEAIIDFIKEKRDKSIQEGSARDEL